MHRNERFELIVSLEVNFLFFVKIQGFIRKKNVHLSQLPYFQMKRRLQCEVFLFWSVANDLTHISIGRLERT